jgi:hypothetical protein
MGLAMFFWEARKRERIHDQIVLQVGDNLVEYVYSALADHDMTDTADFVGERVKDGTWCNIPGEQSS